MALVALLLIVEGVGHGLLAVAYTDIVTSHAPGARPRRRRQPRAAHPHDGHGERRGGADGVAGQRRGAASSGIDGFLAGYRYAFLAGRRRPAARAPAVARGSESLVAQTLNPEERSVTSA